MLAERLAVLRSGAMNIAVHPRDSTASPPDSRTSSGDRAARTGPGPLHSQWPRPLLCPRLRRPPAPQRSAGQRRVLAPRGRRASSSRMTSPWTTLPSGRLHAGLLEGVADDPGRAARDRRARQLRRAAVDQLRGRREEAEQARATSETRPGSSAAARRASAAVPSPAGARRGVLGAVGAPGSRPACRALGEAACQARRPARLISQRRATTPASSSRKTVRPPWPGDHDQQPDLQHHPGGDAQRDEPAGARAPGRRGPRRWRGSERHASSVPGPVAPDGTRRSPAERLQDRRPADAAGAAGRQRPRILSTRGRRPRR